MIFNGSYTPWRFLTLQTRYERFSPNFSNIGKADTPERSRPRR